MPGAREVRAAGAIEITPYVAAGTLDTLEDVLRWGADILEVVVQDEYCHDVICQRGALRGFVVFDTT